MLAPGADLVSLAKELVKDEKELASEALTISILVRQFLYKLVNPEFRVSLHQQ